MSKYQIEENPGDLPTVLMVGTFSIDQLQEIIAEMEDLYASQDTDFTDEIVSQMMEDR